MNDTIDTVFPEQRNRRFEVVFNELLKVAAKHAEHYQPNDRYLVDLLQRSRLISAGFTNSSVK
jgi:hypothetical protein